MKKTIERRLEDLENVNDGGGFYMVRLDPEDGLYHFLWDERVMNEDEFTAFERSLDDDDYLMIITRYDGSKEKNDD